MKVIVFGGAGYIGSHVVRELLDRGHQVTVFDNLSSGLRINLFPEATFIHGDILQERQLAEALAPGFDAAVHLAAIDQPALPVEQEEIHEEADLAIFFSSSAAIFGEPLYVPIDESHPQNPENYYGFTKLEIERFLDWYHRLKGLRYAALRYFNAAGYDTQGRIPGLEQNPANLLPVIMEVAAGLRKELQIFGNDYDTPDGTGVRDYVHVTDLARAHAQALDYLENQETLVVNLGSENGLSVLEILESARRITGREIPARIVDRRPGDPAKLVATSRKANKDLAWKAEYSDLESLVESTWKVYSSALNPGKE